MKKILNNYIYPLLIFIAIIGFPIPNSVIIHKDNVQGIYAFAGKIDQGDGKQFVSRQVCTEYWLEKDQQPDVRYVRSCRLGILGLMFGIGFNY